MTQQQRRAADGVASLDLLQEQDGSHSCHWKCFQNGDGRSATIFNGNSRLGKKADVVGNYDQSEALRLGLIAESEWNAKFPHCIIQVGFNYVPALATGCMYCGKK